MGNLWTVFRRELAAYFNSAIAVIFVAVFVIFTSGLFTLQFFQIGKADMRAFFNTLPFVLNLFIPALAMRLWAEERRGNTYELLMTFPMKPIELVLGKFLAGLAFYLFSLTATLTIPLMLSRLGTVDPGPILGGYVGALFTGALFLAAGIFLSGLCKDQIVAFTLGVVSTFALYFTGTEIFAMFVDGWLPGVGTFLRDHVGMAGRLVGFGKGVVYGKDVLYFALTIGVFLFLNALSLEGRLRPKAGLFFSAAAITSFTCVVLANWLVHDLPLGRWDWTRGQRYTISDASLRILKGLKAPALAKLYISPSDAMPTGLKTLEREIRDTLDELGASSSGNFQYRVIHLETGVAQDDALKKSLEERRIAPFQVESIQRDEVGVKLIYSTLTLEYKENAPEIVPRVLPQTLPDLEYQLLSRIYKLSFDEKPEVAVYAPYKSEELSDEMTRFLEQTGQKREAGFQDEFRTATLLIRSNGYEMSRIALTEADPIPDRTKTLLVLQPQALTDRQLYEINRFLTRGGSVVLAAQGFEFTYRREQTGVEAVPSRLSLDVNRLLEKWGVKISDQMLFDERSQVISLTTDQRIGPFAVEMPVQFPNQIVIDDASINRSSPLTNRTPSLYYLWGAALDVSESVVKQAGLEQTVLFTSSPKSWKVPGDGSTLTAQNTHPPAGGIGGRFPLGILLEGRFSDTFVSVPPWSVEGAATAPPADKTEPKTGRLLVLGCSEMFSEESIRNPGNLNFFANLVDGFTLGVDLIEIRSKRGVVHDLRRLTNAEKIGYRFMTVVLVPLVFCIASAVRFFLRAKEKELYVAALRGEG